MVLVKNFLSLILGVALMGCSWLNPPEEENSRNTLDPDIIWDQNIDFRILNKIKATLDGDNLYLPLSGYGLSLVNVDNGETIWWNNEIYAMGTNVAIMNNRIYNVFEYEYEEGLGNFFVYDQLDGTLLGRYWFEECIDDDAVIVDGEWLEIYGNYLYFALDSPYYEDQLAKVFRIDLQSLELTDASEIPIIQKEIFFSDNSELTFSTRPIFEGDKVYLLSGGIGTKIPEDEAITKRGQYHQSDVRLRCLDLSGNILWETGFEHTGWAVYGDGLRSYEDDKLLLAAHDGLALLYKDTGEIIYEKEGYWADTYLTIEGEYAYSTIYNDLKCFHIPTGELIWTDTINYTRDCKPIIFNNHVYVVDSDALRMYDKSTGELLGVNYDLGVPGYRWQRYMPFRDDELYILKTEKIVAIRME
jgi:hypothetical protein